jgi:hypothetical protein
MPHPALPRFTWAQAILCFLVAAGLDIVMALRDLGDVLGGGYINPDSTMRILRLEEILRTGHLVHAVPRDGSGMGTLLHWSHFLDAVLLALAAPFMAFMDTRLALHTGGMLLGPLSTGLLGVALAWSCAPLVDPARRWFAAMMTGAALPISAYGAPGVVHHHIPVALAVVIALGWAARGPISGARAGLWMGIAAGIGILLTPEAMPFLLMGFGGLGIVWLTRPDDPRTGRVLATAGWTFLAVVGAWFAIDPPAAGYRAAEIDRVSVVWVALAGVCAAIGTVTALCDRIRPRPAIRILAGLGAALLGLGGWLLAFPMVAKGPQGLMPPDIAAAFFDNLSEMQPIASLKDAATYLTPGILGLAVAVWLAWRTRAVLAAYGVLCAAVLVVLAIMHLRFSTYPALLGAAMLPVGLTLAGEHVVLRLTMLGAFLLVPPVSAALGAAQGVAREGPGCRMSQAAALLAPYDGVVVMADPNLTPDLLYNTGVQTVGSLYHRNAVALVRLRRAWASPPGDTMPAAVALTGASLVLICPAPRPGAKEDTLLAALNAGHPPPWLKLVGAAGYVLYRVVPP